MEQGRSRWQTLGELGERFTTVERELQRLTASPEPRARGGGSGPGAASNGPGAGDPMEDLERAWTSFETQQELEQLKRRQG
jgi:hypothetical protein